VLASTFPGSEQERLLAVSRYRRGHPLEKPRRRRKKKRRKKKNRRKTALKKLRLRRMT
jgi:hypothetical protein